MAVTRERKLEIAERSYTLLTEKYGMPRARTSSSTRSSSRARTGDENYVGSAVETIEGMRAHQGSASRSARRSSASPTCRSACPTAGREVLNSVFLYHCTQGRPRPGDRELREAGALPVDPRGGAQARRGPALQPRRRIRSPRSPRTSAAKKHARRRRDGRRCRSTSGSPRYIIEGTKDGLVDDLEPSAKEAGAARDHQRPADEGHGRGRPALQRQRADRRRGAAERRGDEGRGRPPRAVHGEGRRPPHAARSSSPR